MTRTTGTLNHQHAGHLPGPPGKDWPQLHENPLADALLRLHLARVVAAVLTRCTPQAILLTGSFGRGEGSVLVEDGPPRFLSDVEIAVVGDDPRERRALLTLAPQLSAESGIDTCLFWLRTASLRQLRIKNLCFGRQPLTVKMYEILAGSRILYGSVPDVQLPDPATLPRWEGIRLIFNRMAECLLAGRRRSSSAAQLKATSKLVLACADALVIDIGRYDISRPARLARFRVECRAAFPGLFRRLPGFLGLVEWAAAYQTNPYGNQASWTELARQGQAANVADRVLRLLLRRELDLAFDHYPDGMVRYLRHPHVWRSYVDYRLGPATNPLYPNLIYAAKLARHKNRPRVTALGWVHVPWDQLTYAALTLLFHAPSPNGTVDWESLRVARRLLAPLRSLPPPAGVPEVEFTNLREAAVELWQTLVC